MTTVCETLPLIMTAKLVKKLAGKRFMEQLADWATTNDVKIGFPEGTTSHLLFFRERDRLLFQGRFLT